MTQKKLLLSIEGSSGILSVSLFLQHQLLKENFYYNSQQQFSEIILTAIDEILNQTNKTKQELKAICTTTGPGVFTSVRIILAYVISIGIGLNIPVYTLDSIKASALSYLAWNRTKTIRVTLKASKNSFYTAAFAPQSLLLEKPTAAKIENHKTILPTIKDEDLLVGNGILDLKEKFGLVTNGQQLTDNYLKSSNLASYLLKIKSLKNYQNTEATFLR